MLPFEESVRLLFVFAEEQVSANIIVNLNIIMIKSEGLYLDIMTHGVLREKLVRQDCFDKNLRE